MGCFGWVCINILTYIHTYTHTFNATYSYTMWDVVGGSIYTYTYIHTYIYTYIQVKRTRPIHTQCGMLWEGIWGSLMRIVQEVSCAEMHYTLGLYQDYRRVCGDLKDVSGQLSRYVCVCVVLCMYAHICVNLHVCVRAENERKYVSSCRIITFFPVKH